MKIIIFANGRADDSAFLQSKANNADYVICCDGGANIAAYAGIIPDIIIGDLDSVCSQTLQFLSLNNVEIQRHNKHKDYTDLELAIKHAVALKPSEIAVLCAFGGRVDHFIGNIHALVSAAESNINVYLINEDTKTIVAAKRVIIVQKENYSHISLIPFTAITNITTTGLKYPLTNADLHIGTTRGISNVFADNSNTAKITFSGGLLLIILSK